MKNYKISVIIPIYKVEKYLNKCIDSVINQTYKNLEIILVDDGSPDNCPIICDEYGKKDSRVKVIHKKNGGLSDARNAGINESTGEYLLFVDGDDYIHYELCKKAVFQLESNSTDAVYWGNYHESNNEIDGIDLPKIGKGIVERAEIKSKWLPAFIGISYKDLYRWFLGNNLTQFKEFPCVWRFLYKKIVIVNNKITFVKELVGEDVIFNCYFLYFCQSISVINEPLYYYVNNDNSIYRTLFNSEKLLTNKIALINEKNNFTNHCNSEDKDLIFSYWQGNCVLLAVQMAIILSRKPRNYIKYLDFLKLPLVKNAYNNLQLKNAPLKLGIPVYLIKYKFGPLIYLVCRISNLLKFKIYPVVE